MEGIREFIPNIHKEGHVFVALFFLATCLFFMLSSKLGYLGLALTLSCALFFRDPERVAPADTKNIIISPADGIITSITKVQPPEQLDMQGVRDTTRISIFLSVFDVHVNRVPMNGVVKHLHYHPGKFFNASLDKASEHNERQLVLIEDQDGHKIGVVQIAGLIARRIVCDLQAGQAVNAGARFGIIRFGSRVDLYLPPEYSVEVLPGQYMIGGETVMARLSEAKPKKKGTK